MELGGGRFLVFELAGDEYAVEVERVEVVLEMMPITRVPKAPPHLKGVINYRGSVIPVGDLRESFAAGEPLSSAARERLAADLDAAKRVADEGAENASDPPPAPAGKDTALLSSGSSIIVLHLSYSGEDIVMGILADSVREVMDIDPSHIEAAPSLGREGASSLIAGIGEKDGCFIVILDIDAAFSEGGDFSSSGEAADEGKAEEARRDSLLAREGR